MSEEETSRKECPDLFGGRAFLWHLVSAPRSQWVNSALGGCCTEMVSAEVQRRCSSACRAATTSSRCCINTSVRSREPSTPAHHLQRRHLRQFPLWLHAPRRSALIQTWMTSSKLSSAQQQQRRRLQLDKAVVSLFVNLSFTSNRPSVTYRHI